MPNLVNSSLFTAHRNVRRRRAGFTLIELLIVIAIIGILSSIVTFSVSNAQAKSRDSRRKSDMSAIKKALELAKSDTTASSYYPSSLSDLAPNYIKVLPTDPRTGTNYIYTPQPGSCTTACTSYFLQTTMENIKDPDREPSWAKCPGAPGGPDYVVCPD